MPRISVLTITGRMLYLKDQVASLRSQTFQDFEWVIVDSNYLVNMQAARNFVAYSFPLVHLQDREERVYFSALTADNWGLVHCSGELVYFMMDYVLPHPNCLERHWEIYQKYKGVFISGRSYKINMTPDAFDSTMGMVGAQDFRIGLERDKVEIEPDLFLIKNNLSTTWWAGRNDSAPLKALLDCNGFEEDLDGRWGGGDGEMANRLMTYGLLYLHDMKSFCLEFQHLTGDKKAIRSHDEQLELASNLAKTKREQGIYKSNVKRDLWKEREKCLKQ